jgi:ribosomal protein S6--L-glutamate ligase
LANTLILVNAEEHWASRFADFDVYSVRLQTAKWLLEKDTLWVFDQGKRIRVDNIFWRIGATRHFPNHRDVLELIRFSRVPCLNTADVLLRDLHRLGMLHTLRECGLPVVPFTGFVGETLMKQVHPQVPSVIKIGTHHAGYGKMRLTTLEQWQDMTDVVVATHTYSTIEPFIDYVRDIRILAVGDKMWAMGRKGSRWKANSGTVDMQRIAAPDVLYEYTQRVVNHIGADILALDILETQDGEFYVLESNVVPGFDGFPGTVVDTVVERSMSVFSLQ